MEDTEKPVWLQEPEVPPAEGAEDNPECFPIAICNVKCCDCHSHLI